MMGSTIMIFSWMAKELFLKNNELISYAAIYGFSQDGRNYNADIYSYLFNFFNIVVTHVQSFYMAHALDTKWNIFDIAML